MPTPTTPDAAVGSTPAGGPSADPGADLSAGPAADLSAGSAAVAAGPEPVLAGRARIDALDQQIGELILRRIEVSRAIQAARIADGGRRVDLRRESEIIGRYRAALGRPGTTIAMALLELCRGRA